MHTEVTLRIVFGWIITILLAISHFGICRELFDATCSTALTNSLFGYNITCIFTITGPASHTLHFVSLNWTLPSQSNWNYDGKIGFRRGVAPASSYVCLFCLYSYKKQHHKNYNITSKIKHKKIKK